MVHRQLSFVNLKKMTPAVRQQIARRAAKALNAKLTPQQRKESARRSAQARWAKARKKND